MTRRGATRDDHFLNDCPAIADKYRCEHIPRQRNNGRGLGPGGGTSTDATTPGREIVLLNHRPHQLMLVSGL